MQQYKIPQEITVEDKVIGPFTLKGFGFILVSVMITFLMMSLLTTLGLELMTAFIIGAFFGSFSLIIGFIPFNGRPLYIYTLPLLSFVTKSRKRVWQKDKDEVNDILEPASQIDDNMTPSKDILQKESLSSARDKIKELSLTVDTGGAYEKDASSDMINNSDLENIDMALQTAQQKNENKESSVEPLVSDLASVDPKKKFEYAKLDTSEYKLGESINKEETPKI